MESRTGACESRDILSRPGLAFLVFWLPAMAIFVAGTPAFSNAARTAVWSLALALMGTACIANAFRCGRTHCYLTGPFFLIMALSSLLYGIGVAPLGPKGWNLIGLTILVGAISLCCLPEVFLGKYRKGRVGQANRSIGPKF